MTTPEQHQIDVWNAILNPPGGRSSVADLVFAQEDLDLRNEIVGDILESKTVKERQQHRDVLAGHDRAADLDRLDLGVENYDMDGLYARRDEVATTKLKRFDLRDVDDLNELKAEMAAEVSRRSGVYGDVSVSSYFNEHLFADFEIDRLGRAVRKPDHLFPQLDLAGSDGGHTAHVVSQYSGLVENAAEYMLHSDRVWKLMEDGMNRGRLDPSVAWLMDTVGKGQDVGPKAYAEIMNAYQINAVAFDADGREMSFGTAQAKSTVEEMVESYLGDWADRREWVFNGFANEGAERFSVGVNEGGVYQFQEGGIEDLPLMGSKGRYDAHEFELFRSFHWEFDKDIAYNVDKILREPRFENAGYHPAVGVIPKSWLGEWKEDDIRSVLRVQLKHLQNQIVNAPGAFQYNVELEEGEVSVETGFELWKSFHQKFGTGGSEYSKVLVDAFGVKEDETWAESIRDSRLNRAEAVEYLEIALDPGEKPSDELITEVMAQTRFYSNLGEMVEDTRFKTKVRDLHQARLDERRFDDRGLNMDLSNVRETALKDFMSEYLGMADYSEFLKGERDTDYYDLVDAFGVYEGGPEARRDQGFMDSVDGLIAGYRQATIDRRTEEAAVEAREDIFAAEEELSEDTALFRNRLIRMFREGGPAGPAGEMWVDGMINVDTDPAFVSHIDNTIIPRIIQKAFYGNKAYATEADVRAIYKQALLKDDKFYGLNPYDIDEAFFAVQFDESRPPGFPGGFPGGGFVEEDRFAPTFDLEAFAGRIDSAAIESPEFANYLTNELSSASFEEAWQEAALPKARRDRGAELQSADDRVASFQAAYDRSVESRVQRQRDLDAARFSLRQVESSPGASEADLIAAQDAVTQAESAKESGSGAIARAQAALSDATSRAAREKGEVTAEYETYTGTRYDPKTQRIVEAERARPTGKQVPVTSLFTQEGGVWNIDPYQYARERRGAYIESGLTQEEFYERELPGLTERYKGSSLYAREQERLEAGRAADEADRITEERRVEALRRNRLSSSRAMSVFGRRA